MPDAVESTATETVKKTSDGSVKIAVEKYNEMLDTAAEQKAKIVRLDETVTRLRNQPPTVHRTVVQKTPEVLAQEQRGWGVGLMALGVGFFAAGASLFRAGSK